MRHPASAEHSPYGTQPPPCLARPGKTRAALHEVRAAPIDDVVTTRFEPSAQCGGVREPPKRVASSTHEPCDRCSWEQRRERERDGLVEQQLALKDACHP